MKTKYIVGRPLQINGEKFEIGDELSAQNIEAIPRLESYINGRFIFQVVSDRDAKRLPNFVVAKMHSPKRAEELINKNGSGAIGERTDAIEAEKAHAESRQVQVAERDAKIQEFIYASNRAQPSVPVAEEAVDADEPAEETVEVVEEPSAPEEEPVEEPDVEVVIEETPDPTEPFDPFEHSVAEVKDYIGEHPDEEEDILLKEIDGKARKGLVGE